MSKLDLISSDRGRMRDFHGRTPTSTDIWQLLQLIPDPEMPPVSIVDLGIVRQVSQQHTSWRIDITPTYSGCPATDFIANEVQQHLKRAGIKAEVKTQLAPAWSSTWISDKGRKTMLANRIVPPLTANNAKIACPNCGSIQVKVLNQFGSTPCKALYSCQSCAEPFDYFKPL